MLESATPAAQRRVALRAGLASGELQRWPGAFNALVALMIERHGFEGVYVSGAVVAASRGLPDIGLTTLSELTAFAAPIAAVTGLPTVADADTGFGEPMHVARTIQALEDAGVAGCHLEDQVAPKRCGHLDGKSVVPVEEMLRRLAAAVAGRRDENFVLCARTDAVALEGVAAAIERAKAYVDAGADMIFAEALTTAADFERFRASIDVPLLANLTEFGRTPLLSTEELTSLGVNAVIYPVTLFRSAMGAVERTLESITRAGSQSEVVGAMQTRARLYDLLDYDAYREFDAGLVNFTVPGAGPSPQRGGGRADG